MGFVYEGIYNMEVKKKQQQLRRSNFQVQVHCCHILLTQLREGKVIIIEVCLIKGTRCSKDAVGDFPRGALTMLKVNESINFKATVQLPS